MEFGDWILRLLPGVIAGLFSIVAFDWLQTRSLNARRRLREADDRVVDEIPAPATRVYLAAAATCGDLGWSVYASDDGHYLMWAINPMPHPGLRNVAVIIQVTPFGSGETQVTLALNSPHPAWVRRRFQTTARRFLDRLRLRALGEPLGSELPPPGA